MDLQPLTLGQALAKLAAAERSINFSETGALFSSADEAQLKALRLRLQTLRASNANDGAWRELPERCCETTAPFLAANDDFFLRGIFLSTQIKNDDGYVTRLFKHLNNCYWCFEEFCLVMRDYYNKSQELIQTR